MAKGGRKSYLEEMQIKERYTDLSEPFFKVLNKYLSSGEPKDEKWAVEQLNKAYVKMIPQDIQSKGEKIESNTIVFQNFNDESETTS